MPPIAAHPAAANLAANLAALAETQPRLAGAIEPALPDLEFVFGRDGYLTAFDRDDHWWSGCSLPKRANVAMLRSMKITGPVSCLLAPPHAASIRVALDMSGGAHAIVAVVADMLALSVLLACEDFSTEIHRHRLWFAWGNGWADELERLFDEQSGLPTPTQFIRLPVTEQETIDQSIKMAQRVFAAVGARRSASAREIRDAWRPSSKRRPPALCVLTTREFSLWNDAAFALAAASPSNQVPVRLDEPLHGSPLALLSAAVQCDAMVTADLARADMTELLPKELPWVTWMTTPRVPSFAAAGPNDMLLLADGGWKRRAEDAGWPAERIALARWPDLAKIWASDTPRTDEAAQTPWPEPRELDMPTLAIIADTFRLDPPESLDDYSSQRLLWNSIRKDLEATPLILAGGDPGAYLEENLKRFGVSGEGLDRRLFLDQLIVPCYGQGIARLILGAGLPLRLYGAGWSDLPEFARHSAGTIISRADLARAVAVSSALVHVWPTAHVHPIEAAGRPVVRPLNRRTDTFIREAADAVRRGSSRRSTPTICQSDSLKSRLQSILQS